MMMMLEDKFMKVDGMTQPSLSLGRGFYRNVLPNQWRGMLGRWRRNGDRGTLNDGPHFKEDNIGFFDGHAITASPTEIYEEEYWLMAK